MLAKLLKYDFAALSRVLIPVHLVAVLVGFAAAACFFLTGRVEGFYTPSGSSNPFAFVLMPVGGMCMLALGAAPVATFVVIVRRWYANLFTDEGYLTLTLPVSVKAHVASKTIAGFAWMILDLSVVFALLTASVMAQAGSMGIFGWSSGSYEAMMSAGQTVLSLINGAVQVLALLLLAYVAFALGAVVASRHRVAAGVGIFVGVSWAIGLVSTFVSMTGSFLVYRSSFVSALSFSSQMMSLTMSLVGIVVWLAVSAGLFSWCVHLLKNKVDLP